MIKILIVSKTITRIVRRELWLRREEEAQLINEVKKNSQKNDTKS